MKDKTHEQTHVYVPASEDRRGFAQNLGRMIRNVADSRDLIWQMLRRDILVPYKRSMIGVGWIVISPVLGIVSWLFLNAVGMLNHGEVGVPYPAYLLLGSSIWGLFMGCYTATLSTLSAGSGLILQVKFPHEALFIKQILNFLADFVVGFAVNIAVLLAVGVVPSWQLVLFPALVLPLVMLGAGIGLVVCVVNVVVTDIQKTVTFVLGAMIFVTPVIYSSDYSNPLLQAVIRWNPLNYLVSAPRDLIFYGRFDHPFGYALASLSAFAVFAFAWRLFFVSEPKIIEKMV